MKKISINEGEIDKFKGKISSEISKNGRELREKNEYEYEKNIDTNNDHISKKNQ